MSSTRIGNRALESGRLSRAESGVLSGQPARLTNGSYHVHLTSSGSGFSDLNSMAVTRRALDQASDTDGFYVYLRDLDDSFVWSAGYQPVRQAPSQYDFRQTGKTATITRVDREIESQLTVCVVPGHNVELRRCRLTNLGNRSRRIELTSYVEFILNMPQAHASHPTFSKIFLESQFLEDIHTIIVKRRQRSPDAPKNCGFHRLLLGTTNGVGPAIQFETNRARFIGRGRSLADPRALSLGETLSGDRGAVLDPIGSLRASICCEPGDTKDVFFLLGASEDFSELDALLSAIGDASQATLVLERAASADASNNGLHQPFGESSRESAEQYIVHPPHGSDETLAIKSTATRASFISLPQV